MHTYAKITGLEYSTVTHPEVLTPLKNIHTLAKCFESRAAAVFALFI